MKTREEFVLLADAYRKEVRWRGCLLFLAMVCAFFASEAVTGFIVRTFAVYNADYLYTAGFLVWIVLFFVTIILMALYQIKSLDSLARKLEVVCPTCSRAIKSADVKQAIATQHCPYCGRDIFS